MEIRRDIAHLRTTPYKGNDHRGSDDETRDDESKTYVRAEIYAKSIERLGR